jgi:tetratricopeptide (TPR) repeat protein
MLLLLGAGILVWERRQRAAQLQSRIVPNAPPLSSTTHLIADEPLQLSFLDATQPNPPGRTWSVPQPLRPRLFSPPTTPPRAFGLAPPQQKQSRGVYLLAALALSAFACALTLALMPWGRGQAGNAKGVVVGIAPFVVAENEPQPSAPLAEYIMQAVAARGYDNVTLRVAASPISTEAQADAERERLGADFLIWGDVGPAGDFTATVTLHPLFAPRQRQWQLYTETDVGTLILPQHSRIGLPASLGTDPLVPLASALIALREGDYRGAVTYAGGAGATLADGGGVGDFPRLLEATSAVAAGDPQRAVGLFDALEAEGRLGPEGAANRAIARLMLPDYSGAIMGAEQVLNSREAPNRATARAYLVRARARIRSGSSYAQAISDLDEAARRDPTYPLYRLDKAEAFYRQAQPDAARTELSALTSQWWDAAPAYRLAGLVHLMLGRPDDAFAPLDKAAELYTAWLAEMRGEETAAQVEGDAARAQAATEAILKLNRELATVHLYGGMAWADKAGTEPPESFLGGVWRNIRGEPTTYERAIRRMEEASRLDPNRADVAVQMGNVYVAMGDARRGAEALDRARALDPTAPEPYMALARLQEAQGNPREAIARITELVGNAAHFYPAYEELYRLYKGLGDEGGAQAALASALSVAPRMPADNLWHGKFLRILGRNEEAIREFNAALADPELWEAHVNLGELLEEAGRSPDALEEFQQALAKQPNDPRALLGAGRLLVLAGETNEAEKLFSRLTSLAPHNVDGHIAYSQLRLQRGDLNGALESAKRAVEAGPSRADTHFYLGVAHEAREEWGEAASSFKATLERDAGHFEALIRLARSLLMADRPAESVEVAGRAVEMRGGDPQAHRWLAEARLGTGDPTGALQSLSRALELRPGWPEALALASRAYLLGDDLNNAISYAGAALEGNPRDPASHAALGDALVAQGRYIEAIVAFDAALGVSPRDPAVLTGKGRAQAASGDHIAALATFAQALQADDRSAEAYLYSARSYEALGNLEEAYRRYARAAELRPNWAEALVDLGNAQLARGEGDRALNSFERATKAAPNMASAWVGFGMSLRRQGRLPEATEAHLQATRLDDGNPDAWLNLGLTLEERGDKVSAQQAFTNALNRATGDSVRRQAESGLERVK